MSDQPTYRFKYVNIDLQAFAKDRRFAADLVRREAAMLIKKAEAMESEAWEWEKSLEAVDNEG